MLNIPSKKELTEVVEQNKGRFLATKKKILQKALKRDKEDTHYECLLYKMDFINYALI